MPTLPEIVVGVVPSERKHKIVFQTTRSRRSSQRKTPPISWTVLLKCAIDFASLDAVPAIGRAHLDVAVNLRSAMDKSDASAVSPQIQSHLSRNSSPPTTTTSVSK